MGKGEKFGGAATQGMGSIGREPPAGNGRPIPAMLEHAEGCFNSLAGVVATESSTLVELMKDNAVLTASSATLITSNSTPTTSSAKITKAVAESKGAGEDGGGGGGKRGDAKYCPNCKHDTWHKADDCFELEKNKDKRSSYWKTAL